MLESKNTFAMVAEEYMSRKTHIAPSTIKNNYRQLKRLNTYLGSMPITDIKPMDVLEACRSAEAQGYIETAVKMRTMAGQVFRYGVQTGRCERDITQDLLGALKTPVVQHHPTILDTDELGRLLSDIDEYQGSFEVKIAIKLMPMLFVSYVTLSGMTLILMKVPGLLRQEKHNVELVYLLSFHYLRKPLL